MDLSKLPKIVAKSKKRLGRGHGSGKVKTSGRGTKGQKARDSIKAGFEGGQLALIKRLPLLRGKGRNGSQKKTVLAVSVTRLNKFSDGAKVDKESLIKAGIISEVGQKVKIIGKEKLSVKLTVNLPCSAGAREAIEKAGGKVET